MIMNVSYNGHLTVVDIPGFQKTIEWRVGWKSWLDLLFNDYDYDWTTMHHVGIHIMKIRVSISSHNRWVVIWTWLHWNCRWSEQYIMIMYDARCCMIINSRYY